MGPYRDEIVGKDGMESLHNNANAGEVRIGVFLCAKSDKLYVICEK